MFKKISCVVVDDSTFYRLLLEDVLTRTDKVDVIGHAANGDSAIREIARLRPEFVTLDIEMPGMNGLEVLQTVKTRFPDVIVVLISSATRSGARITIKALELGALDFIQKPTGPDPVANERNLFRQLRRIANIIETRFILQGTRSRVTPVDISRHQIVPAKQNAPIELVAIGVSTGGPAALPSVLSALGAPFPVPIVIVQHMPPMFVSVLVESLRTRSGLNVVEATDGLLLEPGKVYLAPGGYQARVVRGAGKAVIIEITDDPPENFCKPSIDYMFRSLSHVYGGNVLPVIMTGMGRDGVEGLRALKMAGARVIAQDADSSVVFGMAMEAQRANLVDEFFPLQSLGKAIQAHVNNVTT